MGARAKRVVVAVVGGLLLLAASPRTSYGQVVGEERVAADAAYSERRYEDSAKAYAQVVRTQKGDGEAWFRLGFSLHASKRYLDSVPAYRRAIELKYTPLVAHFNIACAYALAGERDLALTWLEAAVAKGYNTTDQIEDDADLAAVRDDPRFIAAVSRSRRPMSAFKEGRGADALFGLWFLESRDGSTGTMTGNSSAKGLAVSVEGYDPVGRLFYVMLAFRADTAEWLVAGADRDGGIYEGVAALSSGGLVCNGRRPGARGGSKVRLTVAIQAQGTARLTMESINQGAWTTERSYRAESSRSDWRMNGGR